LGRRLKCGLPATFADTGNQALIAGPMQLFDICCVEGSLKASGRAQMRLRLEMPAEKGNRE
jgi:hypothetical protein